MGVLFGDDIAPINSLQYALLSLYLIIGALVNAHFVGSLVTILQSFNREGQQYQQIIDMFDSAMRNVGLNLTLQARIREFQLMSRYT
jgi:hypothetical protein